MKQIFIGTSGYNYQHWINVFYPKNLSPNRWLEFYTDHFNSVELNVTFYRLPSEKTFISWYKRTPTHFCFVIKGSRFITHIKRLKDCKESLEIFFKNVIKLKEKLKCILWQLPPSLRFDYQRLKEFVLLLKKYSFCLHSFELRHKSWFNRSTYEIFKENNINLCIADSPDFPCEEVLTADFIYLRFHGGKILYGSEYSQEELQIWAEKAKKWLKRRKTLFAFFNNDAYGFAPKNASSFKEMLEK